MLSIGAMGHGQGGYYVSLAREDYYLEGGEPPGQWHGRGAARLGLAGIVVGEELTRLLEGFHPHTDRPLIQNAGRENHQPGWDLTFSAPKSVSVLWSQASREVRRTIQEAHHQAVQAALRYLEDACAFTRRGKGGLEREAAELVVATFEHGTSRALDPQLHTHALVLNVCTRADGTSGTVESKPLYKAKMAVGALYRAELAFRLESELGLVVERQGASFHLPEVSPELVREFSKRRATIVEELETRGLASAAAAAAAALHTRQAKELVPREQLFEQWQETGRVFGWSRLEAEALLGKAIRHQPVFELPIILRTATERATEQQSWFTQGQFVRLMAEEAQGRGFGAAAVRTAAENYLARTSEIVRLGVKDQEPVYTTQAMLRLEAELLQAVELSKTQQFQGVTSRLVDNIIASRGTFSGEQAEALRHVTREGGRIRVVAGMAGTGKTTLLSGARMAWKLEGFQVYGAALSGKAAQGLSDGARIRSDTLHRTLLDLQTGRLRLNERSILVLDEAGMIGLRMMKRVVEATERAGALLVLVGDARQLQPIESSGGFAEIQRRLGAAELTEIRRQREEWAREAVHDFAVGDARSGLRAYAERGLLTVAADRHGAMQALVEAWKERGIRAPEEQLIFCGTREEAVVLNRMVQTERAQAGILGEQSVAAPGGGVFRSGDRVLFTRKSRVLGVENGSLGEVTGIDSMRREIAIRLDSGERLQVSLEEYGHVRLSYAVTTHKGQGQTVDRAFILAGGPMQDREISYVQASRAREASRIFVDQAEAGEELTNLVRSMNTSRQKELAHSLRDRLAREQDRRPVPGMGF